MENLTITAKNALDLYNQLYAQSHNAPEQQDNAEVKLTVLMPVFNYQVRINHQRDRLISFADVIKANAKVFGGGKFEKTVKSKAAYSAVAVRILRDLIADKSYADAVQHAERMGDDSILFFNQRNLPFFIAAIEPSGLHDDLRVGLNSLNDKWCAFSPVSGVMIGKYAASKNAAIAEAVHTVDGLKDKIESLNRVLEQQEQHDHVKARADFMVAIEQNEVAS